MASFETDNLEPKWIVRRYNGQKIMAKGKSRGNEGTRSDIHRGAAGLQAYDVSPAKADKIPLA